MSIVGAITSYQQINKPFAYNFSDSDSVQKIKDENSDAKTLNIGNDSMDDEAATATISSAAINLYNSEQSKKNESSNQNSDKTDTQSKSEDELTPQEKQEVSRLKMTDAEVKAHENAHKAAAAGLTTSAPNYEYEIGPDGQKYAVAGDVNVSYPESSDPQVNLQNAQKLKAAALAPANPSSQDRSVARKADMEIVKARQEILEEQNQTDETDKTDSNPISGSNSEAKQNTSTTNAPFPTSQI